MTTSKIETLTDEERELLSSLEKGWTANKALRIIDAHAAERAALTEQVAQLTAALENIALAPEARVRELEAEVQRLKERNAQLVVSSQVRSYEAALDAQERAEKALFQLRERVARAVTWLVSAQTAGFRFQATDAVKCALEALRGS